MSQAGKFDIANVGLYEELVLSLLWTKQPKPKDLNYNETVLPKILQQRKPLLALQVC